MALGDGVGRLDFLVNKYDAFSWKIKSDTYIYEGSSISDGSC